MGQRKSRNPKIERKCEICGSIFKVWPCVLNYGGGRFCSRKCFFSYKKGKRRPDMVGRIPWNKGKSLNVGETHPNWKGGMRKSHGYILQYCPNHPNHCYENYVRRNRLQMEKLIGRYLTKEEVVHHINGDKSDDRIENLQWLPDNATHSLLHTLQRRLNKGVPN